MPPATPLRTGLVSVTFRQLDVPAVVHLAKSAGLAAVEWGGDVHVPPGDAAAARTAREACDAAGLTVAAYGSYYRCGGATPADLDAVLVTAVQLGAPTVRVWAGNLGSAAADPADVARVTDDVRRVCDHAAVNNLTVTLEYHGGTLTDTLDSTIRLLDAVDRPNLRTGWQPRDGLSAKAGVAEIKRLRPWLGNVHVFQWWPTGQTRWPLADGRERWTAYLNAIAADGRDRFALLEFVRNDDPANLQEDANTLTSLVSQTGTSSEA